MIGIGISITNFCRRWISTGEENPNPGDEGIGVMAIGSTFEVG